MVHMSSVHSEVGLNHDRGTKRSMDEQRQRQHLRFGKIRAQAKLLAHDLGTTEARNDRQHAVAICARQVVKLCQNEKGARVALVPKRPLREGIDRQIDLPSSVGEQLAPDRPDLRLTL